MRTYCVSGVDSTKWINRFFRKIGDAPVIYDESVALKSQEEIEKAVRNMGGQGIGLQGFSSKALHNLLVPLPPEEEQIKIGLPYSCRASL